MSSSTAVAPKRKRVVLTIREKLSIVKLLDEGCSPRMLALQFGIGEQTVRDLKKNKEQLERFALASGENSQRMKSMKRSRFDQLEQALRSWLLTQRSQGAAVTKNECVDKAGLLFAELGMEGRFDGDCSWMNRFRLRHRIPGTPLCSPR